MALNESEFTLRSFNELSGHDLYQILQLRSAVFVLEQTCAYQDLDGLDQQALHLFKKADCGEIIAYTRIISPNQCGGSHSSIGRVVVKQEERQHKYGNALMQAAIQVTLKQFPELPIKISAQTYLTHFYQKLGFVNTGQFYLEDQIPHQEMIYQASWIVALSD